MSEPAPEPNFMEATLAVPPDTTQVIDWDWAVRQVSGIEDDAEEVDPEDLEPSFLIELFADFLPSALDKMKAILVSAKLFRGGEYTMDYQGEVQFTEEVRGMRAGPARAAGRDAFAGSL